MGAMKLSSTAFEPDGAIPRKYSCDGDDVNPPLTMENVPALAKSLALVMDDPDAPGGTWVHWVIWNIDPGTEVIIENSTPTGAMQGANSWGRRGYGGPCPPSGTHHYIFHLYALKETLTLPGSSGRDDLEQAMEGKILEQCRLVGTFRRR